MDVRKIDQGLIDKAGRSQRKQEDEGVGKKNKTQRGSEKGGFISTRHSASSPFLSQLGISLTKQGGEGFPRVWLSPSNDEKKKGMTNEGGEG